MSEKKDFLRTIVEEDLKSGKYKEVVTRFPPEPNGFPHIGHAKSIAINFGIASDYQGHCNLRMDDTNPTKEDTKYVEALKDAVQWLGFDWGENVYFTSDYFTQIYDYAIQLIKMDKAYVDSVDEEQMRELRGTVTQAGKRSEFASRSIEENLDLFEKMKNGEFKDGEHVLRAKIDMGAANMKMRDPLLYRIRHAHHFRAGDAWCIYPMYDFAHCLSDYIEGVSHSICTLEFENNRDIYNWVLNTLGLEAPRPYQHEFARLGINYTVMSKRKLLELVDGGQVSGWDDPRMPTIAGYKRRGYTKESILNFCDQIGIAKANSMVDVAQLEFCIRDDLNKKVPRVMCVLDPLKVTIENYEGSEEIDASYYPHDVPKEGERKILFSKEIYIERDDFNENPPKGYFRLTPEQPVRLRHGFIITCKEVIKDTEDNIIEIKAQYHPDSKSGSDTSGIKVKSAIQWVSSKEAKEVEVRVYDRLYSNEAPTGLEDLNTNSLQVIKNALIEPAVILEKPDERFQFERQGYFYADPIDYTDEKPVFNKIVGLKDSWGKKTDDKPKVKEASKKQVNKVQVVGEVAAMTNEQQVLFDKYTKELKLNSEVSNILARDEKLSSFYEEALNELNSPIALANIVTNDVAKELKDKEINELKFTSVQIAQLIKIVDDGTISSKIAKQVFEDMTQSGTNPTKIVEDKGLVQISDPSIISPIIDEVIVKNPDNVEKFKAGNTKLLGFFVGQVLKTTGGKANPQVVNELVAQKLK
ncbi:MAG: glutamine--tRNA ligase/YqeY domain fusion protein [Campylobacteraceae bacterium]|jgi:glutaminyl-tRNA synthetase|nr:glutamine--tRNA ligase/YqeY domain fusion protein [Campylobacteraceae bacterium]MBT4572629.1 glutamine--tRNA ligase/YqeY domain fusion protein [Campylobacteraceae bacterium]MBT5323171.1 glutamine--tRNA ligase/YqeY domain fusion protein [Campylobacteraceae bacterium]MBT5983294.1 glutamine--tRNA ligase/YqeY domain fusion protein [Campylobacteraceae bacterium]MBT7274718.1 glutamine--tRNA ligase/YqeY domain fusion protein [Campylobacteraceae bacterium]